MTYYHTSNPANRNAIAAHDIKARDTMVQRQAPAFGAVQIHNRKARPLLV